MVAVSFVTTLVMLLATCALLLLLLGHGSCSAVVSGLDFGAARPLPQVVKIDGEEMEMWVPIISQIVRKMLLEGGRQIPIKMQRIERIVKRGRETEGSWAPSGTLAPSVWAPSGRSGTDLQPFFARGSVTRIGTKLNREGLFERVL